MARLNELEKRYIVKRLACYDTPTLIAKGVKEEFGTVVSRQQVHEYHPDHGSPARKLCELFTKTREEFDKGVTEPAALLGVRIRRLARMAERAEERGNDVLAAQFYAQIAKDKGGMFTNRRELTGGGGAPVQLTVTRRVVHPAASESST